MSIVPEPNHDVRLGRYAEILVSHAAGLRPGQDVFIRGQDVQREFGLRVGEAAYELGARSVHYHFPDPDEIRQLVSRGSRQQILLHFEKAREYYAELVKRNAVLIFLVNDLGPPEWCRELSLSHPERHAFFLRESNKTATAWHEAAWGTRLFPVVAAPAATRRWAERLFPGDGGALERLWEVIFRFACADRSDFSEVLEEQRQMRQRRSESLNDLGIRELHISGGGNDLVVRLSERARWIDSCFTTATGQRYFPNFPSREIFTTPDARGTEGVLAAGMPFRLHDMSLVSDLAVEFRQGRVERFEASEGCEAFASWIETDAGARRLGEIALVGEDSPLRSAGLCFDSPNLDENAGSHVAFGNGITSAFVGSESLSESELEALGCNKSGIHTDVVFDSPHVSIVATKTRRGPVPLIEGGRWVEGTRA